MDVRDVNGADRREVGDGNYKCHAAREYEQNPYRV